VPLKSGAQVLRLHFPRGEMNIGKLMFTYSSPLTYNQPVADAGTNQIIVLPESTTILDGSLSTNGGGGNLAYQWTQVYGPSTLDISESENAQPAISGLKEGVYLMQLMVDNGTHTDIDEVYIISSTTNNVAPTVSILTPANNAEYYENEIISIAALASDLNDSIQRVELYIDGEFLATKDQEPYNSDWVPVSGNYQLTAVAYDYNNSSTESNIVNVTILTAPPCDGTSWNGDFDYVFSDDDINPTLTFIPSESGVGTPTCILYYGTDPGNLPGYGVTPNVPFTINANEGDKVYFYYTYSYPGEVERNNSANKDSYVVGTCRTTTSVETINDLKLKYYPNPVSDFLNIQLPDGNNNVEVYSLMGELLSSYKESGGYFKYNMTHLPSGVYLITVSNSGKRASIKVIKH
jgi:hypothetical protein